MTYTYTEVLDETGQLIAVNRSDGWWIPADPANSDYQRYLNPEQDEATLEIK